MKKKSIFKRGAVGVITLALALVAISPAVLLNVNAASNTADAQPYPWSKVAGGTTGDYIADSYDNVASGHVFESVTQERLLDILSSTGNYYIVFGSPTLETSQAVLSTINAQAKEDGINKIYHFDPFIDGYQIDITDSDSVFKTANGTSVNELWTRITDLLPEGAPIDTYSSEDTLLFAYNNNGSTAEITASYSLTDIDEYDSAAASADIANVFRGGNSEGSVIPGIIRSDFAFFKRVFNGSATYFNYNSGNGPDAQGNRTGETTTELFTDADETGFALHQVNFVELLNLLNSPGDHIIFFGASWCHNTQAIIKDVAAKAKQYGHQTVYVYDTTLGNQLTFGTGEDINKVTASSSAFNSRNNVNTDTGNGNISYLYGELVNYLEDYITENNSKQNNSISYYPNGDLSGAATSTAPWETGTNKNAIRLQLPFLISYNKDEVKPVTKQWLHKNSADDGTYTEYMLELAWVLKAPNAVAAGGDIDGLSKVDFASEAVQALDNVLTDIYSISLSQAGTYTFPAATVGYGAQQAYGFTVNNTGNVPTGTLGIALSGADSESFTSTKTSINSLASGGSDAFAIAPKAGLAEGTYTATVTVSGDNGISAAFDVSFTVNAVPVQYSVLSDFTTFIGSGDVTAKIDADVTKFVQLLHNGEVVDSQNYTVHSGSTVITLKESYLKTLENGNHNFVAQFTDGTADLTLNINIQSKVGALNTSTTTGDSNNYALWILIGAAAITVIGIFIFEAKRRGKLINKQ